MSNKKVALVLNAVTAILPIAWFAANAGAETEKVLYSFKGGPADGAYPAGGLIMDKNGNLYGVTAQGSVNGGTVFELSPGADSAWTEKVLHSFTGKDGLIPLGGLIQDASGNLYGTTAEGGDNYGVGGAPGQGVVFELTPAASGTWTETVLHSFSDEHGVRPSGGLVFDREGNLYGSTGGYGSCGAFYGAGIFELTPAAEGKWTETELHSFSPTRDGVEGLIFDAAGNLYGTTGGGGRFCAGGTGGTAFELTPRGGGVLTETLLHNFGGGADGSNPSAGIAFDGSGNLYGVTFWGGTQGDGTVFELESLEGGGWAEKILHSFGAETKGGISPGAGLTFDGKGNFYGTTGGGGADMGGEVFEFTPKEGGGWEKTVLHDFGTGGGGSIPISSLLVDAAGNLYGTTVEGGIYGSEVGGYGTVFEILP